MEVKAYRARTMHEALMLVRHELGPDAAVLHTREVRARRLFGLIPGMRQIEVTASADVNVPSRLPFRGRTAGRSSGFRVQGSELRVSRLPTNPEPRTLNPEPSDMQGQLAHLEAMVKQLCRRSHRGPDADLPEELFRLFTDLIDSELDEELARELVERVRGDTPAELSDPVLVKARLARMLEAEIHCCGPIRITPGQRRLVALVGPTGVGKTTTIAKLAANYRLREKCRVGLITVDTYRVAAVEQLRTYADIIDLPMQVVSTPREMREAVRKLDGLDLVLMDTAGRSPKDEVKILGLKAMLTEAAADEVHLVLGSVAGSRTLEQTAKHFAAVGATALVLTKLDEATGLGNVIPVLRSSKLPLSYLTNGQNVPDDIETANAPRLARLVLGMEPAPDE